MKLSELERWLDLGQGWSLLYFGFLSHNPDEVVGGLLAHPHPKEGTCYSLLYLEVPASESVSKPRLNVKQWEPLTLGRQVECYMCGTKGHIKEGQWIPK